MAELYSVMMFLNFSSVMQSIASYAEMTEN